MSVIAKSDLRWLRTTDRRFVERNRDDVVKAHRELYEAMGWEGGRMDDRRFFNREKQQIKPRDFSLRDLFEELVTDNEGGPIGRQLVESFSPKKRGRSGIDLYEAPVSTSAFSNITGQIFFTSVLEAFNRPQYIGERITRNIPTTLQSEEKVPGISLPGDEATAIGENEPYPEIGVSEEWITIPEKVKNGYILSISKESIFGDTTGILLDRADRGSEMMAINKEKRILDTCLGITTSYRRNDGPAQATYANSHTQGDFDNLSDDALVDWTDVESVLLLFNAILDPNIGEPIALEQVQMVVPEILKLSADRILNATEVRRTVGEYQTIGANPLRGETYERLSSPYVGSRSGSTTAWWLGDFQKAFAYYENWPITTDEEREDGHRSFSHDTVLRLKTSEKGTPAVTEPRYVCQGNG